MPSWMPVEEPVQFRHLYEDDPPSGQRIEKIAREVYGAEGVSCTLPRLRRNRGKSNRTAVIGIFATVDGEDSVQL